MLWISGRRLTTGATPLVQRVVVRVLGFHHLCVGKSSWNIHVGNELGDMHHQYMCLLRFLYTENFHYLPEGALEVCHYHRVHKVKREPKYTLINFMEAAQAIAT